MSIIKKRLAVVFILIVAAGCSFGYLCDLTIVDLGPRLSIEISFSALIGFFGVFFTLPWWLKLEY